MPETPITVRIPVPASVRGPRSGKEAVGFVWVDREVEVPVLESEGRCSFPVRADDPVGSRVSPWPRVHGACAGGAHWRGEGNWRYGAMPGVRPYVLSTRLEASARSMDDLVPYVDWTTPLHTRAWTAYDGSDRLVRDASLATARGLGMSVAKQAALVRTHGAGCRGTTQDDMDRPFDLKPNVRVRYVDPEFEAAILHRVRERTATVDGEVMVRSTPPELLVTLSREGRGGAPTVAVSRGYADLEHKDHDEVVIALPISAAGWIYDALRDAVGANGALEGFHLVPGGALPDDPDERVVHDAPVREELPAELQDAAEEILSYRGVRFPDMSLAATARRAAMADALVEPRRTTNPLHALLMAGVAWRRDVGPRLDATPHAVAPAALDALG